MRTTRRPRTGLGPQRAISVLLLVLLCAAGRADETSEIHTPTPPEDARARAKALQSEIAATVARIRPSVVAIEVRGVQEGTARRGGGSGVVIDPAGLVLTNYHVAGWADEITVIFGGSRRVPAKIRGKDEEGDLLLLEVDPGESLEAVTLGDSDRLEVGQWVLAMGNPRGVSSDGRATVTWGTITGLHAIGGGRAGRELFYGDAIQTDAEINPGNSGGPLFDLSGKLIGLNGRIATRLRTDRGTAVNANVGFAIPVNQIRRFLPLLREGKPIRHGYLGIGVEARPGGDGVRVSMVVPDSAAEGAGFAAGDVLLTVDGKRVTSPVRLTNLLSSRPAGARLAFRLRREGEERVLVVALTPRPEASR